jgi:hypothetical protein
VRRFVVGYEVRGCQRPREIPDHLRVGRSRDGVSVGGIG